MLYPEQFTTTGPTMSGLATQNRTWYVLKTHSHLWYAFCKPPWLADENRKQYFRFLVLKNRKYDILKILAKVCYTFLNTTIEPWKTHDRLHRIHGDDPVRASRTTPLERGRKSMQRERHPKFEITLIRKTGTNSSDFALKFTSYFLKTGTTSS